MKIVKRILFGLAMAGVLAAQLKPEEAANQQRVFVLKYADARNVANVLAVFGYGIKADRDMHVLAVSAPPTAMAAIEDAVKKLDVPAAAAKDFDLTVYLVVASGQPANGGGLPSDLQQVGEELKKIFAYKSYRLLDSIVLRTQPGMRATASGLTDRGPYSFAVSPSAVTEDAKGRLIRLDNLDLDLHLPNDRRAGIRTEITVREGQRVVVGKSNIATDESLVLVVTAKVAE